ncbi:MAG: type VII toxin-antitoxin system MntA family adenylyltransferase antitoxin, partial [Gemmatimonadota bacterium]
MKRNQEEPADSTAATDSGAVSSRLGAVLRSRPEVVFAYQYGSTVGQNHNALSDLDVAAYLDPETLRRLDGPLAELHMWTDLQGDMEEAFPGIDVDLVLLHRAPPLLSERILRHGRLLLSRDEALRLRWTVETKSRYCDLAPLRRTLNRALEDRIRA